MSFPEKGKIWSNGEIIPWNDAKVHVMTHGLHYGSGIFEGIRVYDTPNGPCIFRLDDHIERFFNSAKLYMFEIPFAPEQIRQGILDVVRANNLKNCYVRPIAFIGYGRLGVYPDRSNMQVHIGAWEWGAYLGEDGLTKGARVTLSGWTKFQSKMFPVLAKACGQYLNSMLAVMDAKDRGYDEAILLNVHGDVAEGSGENVFIVKNNKLITNTMSSSVLDGITRNTIIELAQDYNIQVFIKDMTLGELLTADEAFFTGTAAEVTPIREIDGRSIGNGDWPITWRLQDKFFDVVKGKVNAYRHWLTPVYN